MSEGTGSRVLVGVLVEDGEGEADGVSVSVAETVTVGGGVVGAGADGETGTGRQAPRRNTKAKIKQTPLFI